MAIMVRIILCGLACAAMLARTPALLAAPVYTVMADRREVGVDVFLADLSRMWRNLHVPVAARLVVTEPGSAALRLRLLNRGRGDFAIVETGAATAMLGEHPGVAAIGVLWPGYLHAVTRARLLTLARPIRQPVLVAGNARYVFDALQEWNRYGRRPRTNATLLPDGGDLLAKFREKDGVLLFSAPAPLASLVKLLDEDSSARIVPISPRLVENLRLLNPWLQKEVLGANTYPRMNQKLLLPARYLVMVGRQDLPEAIVTKMLNTLYFKSAAVGPRNPLFGAMRSKLNLVFARLFPYHPVTAKRLGIPQKSP